VLVDLGANVGHFTAEFLAEYPAARAVIVEGDPYLVGLLRARFESDPRLQIVAALAGARSAPDASFHLCRIPEGNSVFSRFSASWSPGETREIQVPMLTLTEIVGRFELPRVDLLKVDIEGSEWDLLEAFPADLARIVGQLTVEFHDFLDPRQRPRTERCIRHLEHLGYTVECRAGSHGHGSPYFDCCCLRR
jgi:FkbM family methyltransferase